MQTVAKEMELALALVLRATSAIRMKAKEAAEENVK
jgi:hypothetical protein